MSVRKVRYDRSTIAVHRRWRWSWTVVFDIGLFVCIRGAVLILPARGHVVSALTNLLMLIVQIRDWFRVVHPHVVGVVVVGRLRMRLRHHWRRLRVRKPYVALRSRLRCMWIWPRRAISRLSRSRPIAWRQLWKEIWWLALKLIVILLSVGVRVVLSMELLRRRWMHERSR